MSEDALIEISNRFLDAEEEVNLLDAEIKRLTADKEKAKEKMDRIGRELQEYLIEHEVGNFRIRGRLIYVHKQMWAKPKDKDYDRAVAALKSCGLGWLVEEKFNTHTVSAHVRECDEQGNELPPEFYEGFEVKDSYSVRSRKG